MSLRSAFKAVGWMRARNSEKKCRKCQRQIRIHFSALILEIKDDFIGNFHIPLCEACGRDFERGSAS